MKKLFSIFLAAVLALSLTACKKTEPQPTQSPLPSPPAQENPVTEPEKEPADPFEVEATVLTQCIVAALDDFNVKTGKYELDYEDFLIYMALVDNEDFTYNGLAPVNADGGREFNPQRCEIIINNVFGKQLEAGKIFDDDIYNKDKKLYILPGGEKLDFDYKCENLSYISDADHNNATVTFDLMEEKDDVPGEYTNLGRAYVKFVIATEKGGAYWRFDSFGMV